MTTLVAEPTDFTTPLSGLGVGADIESLCASIGKGDWVAAGIDTVSTVISAAATIADPIGSALSAGVGWVIDHLNPLKEWLQHLTGNPGAVAGFGGTWANISVRLESCSTSLDDSAKNLQDLDGNFVRMYQGYVESLNTALRLEGTIASAISAGFQIASGIVQFVYTLVRDAIADIVGKAIAWVAEALFSLGLAAPGIIGQVVTTVAKWASRVGGKIDALLSSMKGLKSGLTAIHGAAEKLTKTVANAGNALSKRAGLDLDSLGSSATAASRRSMNDITQDVLSGTPKSFFDKLTDGEITVLVGRLASNNSAASEALGDAVKAGLNPLRLRELVKELFGTPEE